MNISIVIPWLVRLYVEILRNSPLVLARELSYVQVDSHGITVLYHLHVHQCRPCTSGDISC